MNILSLIEKKKNNEKISEQEFDWFVKNLLTNNFADYQTSAFLMSIWFSKLDFDETYYLTKAIVENGRTLKYPANIKNIIDKHSTGGVGDKVSLILLPILSSLGVNVAKISGRGLGHTGGTIDKLDAINVRTDLTEDEAMNILEKEKMFIMQQTNEIVPADKILYAIRDTSGSVDNMSLIVASIMSKKIATNADFIYLDTKVGNGAFFPNLDQAHQFGELCIKIGKKFNKKLVVHYTDMDKPLGRGLGNLLEVKESIDFLNNKIQCKYLKELIYEFAKDVLLDLNICNSKNDAYSLIDNQLISKKAYNHFKSWANSQNSNLDFDKLLNQEYTANYVYEIKSETSGYVNLKSSKEFGMILIDLKAGRKLKTDTLDFISGIYLNKYNGEYVNAGETIITIYSSNIITEDIINKVKNNLEVTNEIKNVKNTILGVSK